MIHLTRSLPVRIFVIGLMLIALLVGVRAFLSTRPWPATNQYLSDAADLRIGERTMTNLATEQDPILLEPEQRIVVEGSVSRWDYPFTQPSLRQAGDLEPTRTVEFLLVFRQIEILRSSGGFHYRGRTRREVLDDGQTLRLTHTATAPEVPGLYRVQLLALERNPAMLARSDPEAAVRPLGVIAEGLARVE